MQADSENSTQPRQASRGPIDIRCLFVGRAGGDRRGELIAALQSPHCQVEHHERLDDARARANEAIFDLAVFELGDERVDLETLCADWLPISAVAVTCEPSQREHAVRALARGVANFACADYDVEQFAAALRSAATARWYERDAARLTVAQASLTDRQFIIGCSPVMRRLDSAMRRAAEIDATVLIEGLPGTGKTLVARALHDQGRRAAEPMVALQCAANGTIVTEDTLLHAHADARQGTLLIENIDQLPAIVQSRLVRLLKERNPSSSDCARLIATTSGRLAELTARNAFREDLYYRLNVFPMQLPTLRERTEDIVFLAEAFLAQASSISGRPASGFAPSAMILLETNPWPGNVAQLRNVVFRAHALAGKKQIDRVHLMGPTMGLQAPLEASDLRGADAGSAADIREADVISFQEEERRILARALKAAKGNVRRAAEMLGIGRATLYRKIQIFELNLS